MFTNVTEIVLIIVIVIIVFGMGKLPSIATRIGRMRSEFNKGLEGESQTIDITPSERSATSGKERKPGKFNSPIEDASVDEA